jgi:hypothetical protein
MFELSGNIKERSCVSSTATEFVMYWYVDTDSIPESIDEPSSQMPHGMNVSQWVKLEWYSTHYHQSLYSTHWHCTKTVHIGYGSAGCDKWPET